MTSETKKEKSGTDLPPEDDAISRAVRQERINAEILKAVEMLGDRLARSEERRTELEEQVKKLESRPRALISLPVIRRAGPPALIASGDGGAQASQKMSLPRLALVAAVSAFIVTSGFGLGVIYGQNGFDGHGFRLAALMKPGKPVVEDNTIRPPDPAKLADLVVDTGKKDAPVPFSSLAVREDSIARIKDIPSIAAEPAESPHVIRMGEAKPVSPEQLAAERMAEVTKPDMTAKLPEVDVAAVRATPPKDEVAEETVKTPMPEAMPPREEPPVAARQKTAEKTAGVDPANLPAEKFPRPNRDTSLPEKLKKIEQSAFDGLGEAQHDLATYYVSGQDGVQVDYKRAAYWFEQSAASGVANAAYNLGVMYQQGLGVGPDVNMALKWYMEAAQLGHPEAQYNLGVAYAEGQGVTPNMQRAVSFFEQASEQGVAPAAFNLGLIYENGLLGRANKNKAADWYKQAAIMGHDEAKTAWERLTGDDFDAMIAAVSQGEARAANNVAPASGGSAIGATGLPRRGPEVADINVMDQEAHHTMVRQVQQELMRMKLIPGPADGIESPVLADAISAYERKNGLEITGKPSRELLRRLRQ